MIKNAGGRRFEHVSISTGTTHPQKGHDAGFPDRYGDGDPGLFEQMGGAVPGDRAHDILLGNP